jgi:hypothetical protein
VRSENKHRSQAPLDLPTALASGSLRHMGGPGLACYDKCESPSIFHACKKELEWSSVWPIHLTSGSEGHMEACSLRGSFLEVLP